MSDPGKRINVWVPTSIWKAATLAAAERNETLGAFAHDAVKEHAEAWAQTREQDWRHCLSETTREEQGPFSRQPMAAKRRAEIARLERPTKWPDQQRLQIELYDEAGWYRPGEKEHKLAHMEDQE